MAIQRYGETDRIDPVETEQIWKELKVLWESGKLRPTVYDEEYRGLDSVVRAMKDLEARRVWGKAVIVMEHEERPKLNCSNIAYLCGNSSYRSNDEENSGIELSERG